MPNFVHPWELLVVLAIVVIIFGVGRLPEIGGAMGKAIREFKSSVTGEAGTKEDAEVEAATNTKKE